MWLEEHKKTMKRPQSISTGYLPDATCMHYDIAHLLGLRAVRMFDDKKALQIMHFGQDGAM
jgi:hypothetical protein